MHLKNSFCFIIFLFSVHSFGAPQQNDLLAAGYQGKIQSLHEYTVVFNSLTKKFEKNLKTSFSIYNLFGYKTQWHKYDTSGNLDSKDTYIYDTKMNKLSVHHSNRNSSYNHLVYFKYDQKGQELENSYFDFTGKKRSGSVRRYDKAGNIIEWIRYNADQQIEEKSLYLYDQKGRLILSQSFSQNSQLDYQWEEKYDSQGNKVEMVKYNAQNQFEIKESMEYDAAKNLISWKLFTPKGLQQKVLHAYNEKNQLIQSQTFLPENLLPFTEKYRYDGNNNKIYAAVLNPNGSYQYTEYYYYDSFNRQIKWERFNEKNKLDFIWLDKYDLKGNLVSMAKFGPKNKLLYQWNYFYDSRNFLIVKENLNSEKKIQLRWTYLYDTWGNRICMLFFKRDAQKDVLEFQQGKITEYFYYTHLLF